MKDNIGNELHAGDYVFCLTGKYKNQAKHIEGFRIIHENLGDTEAVNFSQKDWLTAVNVVSLTALGVDKLPDTHTDAKQDALGHELHVGDQVLYLHSMEMYLAVGTIQKMTPKSCLLTIKENRFGQTEYRKKYEELISLTALGKENLVIEHHDFEH